MKTQTSVGHIPPAGSPRLHRTAGPGISRMLPEEMLIHVNTSPLRAPRAEVEATSVLGSC